MLTLALESTAAIASVALCEDGRCLYTVQSDCGLTHSEQLLPMVRDALRTVGKAVGDIDLYACTAGPGSFTGVRIAAAVLKGMAYGTGKPCAPVSTLQSLGRNLLPLDGLYCPVMDARRSQVYTALFTCENGKLVRLTPDEAVPLEELAEQLAAHCPNGKKIYLCGDGYGVAMKALAGKGLPLAETPPLLRGQNAFSTALCAEEMAEAGETVTEPQLRPTYLRLPQAERERLAALRAAEEAKESCEKTNGSV